MRDLVLLPGFMCDADLWADMVPALSSLATLHYGNVYDDDSLDGMAARVLAERVIAEAKTPDERLTRAFRRVLARSPSPAELRILRDGLDHHLARFRDDPAAARKLLATGDKKPDPKRAPAELAAYATVCGMILNLDEAVTKE